MVALWRIAVVALLGIIAWLLWWDRDRVVGVIARDSPYETYARALESAGIADTALARDWLSAGTRALTEPEATSLPITSSLSHVPAAPRAYGYRVALQRGRVLRTNIDLTGAEPAEVFIDLFRVTDSGEPERVASARKGVNSLEHEVRRDGAYIVRIQPELLRGGAITIGHRTTASLTFPVSGRDLKAVRSFFRDPRDAGRREHHGVDIFAPRDTPVLAAADGFVSSVGANRLGGNVVWVWDPVRRQSQYYAHLSRQAVSTGQRVSAGDVIGFVGNTGNARTTPPHLHFGIYSFREGPIDPLPFVAGAFGPQPPEGGVRSTSGENPLHDTTGSGG